MFYGDTFAGDADKPFYQLFLSNLVSVVIKKKYQFFFHIPIQGTLKYNRAKFHVKSTFL